MSMSKMEKLMRGYNRLANPTKHPGGAMGLAFGVGMNTIGSLGSGDPLGTSILKGIVGEAAFGIAPVAVSTYYGSQLIYGAAKAGYALDKRIKMNQTYGRSATPTFGYIDTQQAQTMRQAAVQAIQGSKLNARNALGGEAALMHVNYNRKR